MNAETTGVGVSGIQSAQTLPHLQRIGALLRVLLVCPGSSESAVSVLANSMPLNGWFGEVRRIAVSIMRHVHKDAALAIAAAAQVRKVRVPGIRGTAPIVRFFWIII